jgi:hypothetical protein
MNKHETDTILALLLVVDKEGFNHRFLDGLRKSNPNRLNVWQKDTLEKISVLHNVEYHKDWPDSPTMIIHSVTMGREIPKDAVGIELKDRMYDPNEVYEGVKAYTAKINWKTPTEVWILRTDCYFKKEK